MCNDCYTHPNKYTAHNSSKHNMSGFSRLAAKNILSKSRDSNNHETTAYVKNRNLSKIQKYYIDIENNNTYNVSHVSLGALSKECLHTVCLFVKHVANKVEQTAFPLECKKRIYTYISTYNFGCSAVLTASTPRSRTF